MHNYTSAENLAKILTSKDPHSEKNSAALIHSLARSGKAKEALEEWERLNKLTTDQELLALTLEEICWSEIQTGASSSSIKSNYFALISAIGTRHVRAVRLVERFLFSSNPLFKTLSIKMAQHLGDERLKKALLHRLRRESHPAILSEIILSLGVLQDQRLIPELKRFFKSTSPLPLQLAASIAYAQLNPEIPPEKFTEFIKSKRSGIRILASYLVRENDNLTHIDSLLPLLKDPIPEVRAEAIMTLALSKSSFSKDTEAMLLSLKSDTHPMVRIAANYALSRMNNKESLNTLYKTALSEKEFQSTKEGALGALMHIGPTAFPYLEKILNDHIDPLFRLNAAFTLLLWEQSKEKAINEISHFISSNTDTISECSPFDIGSFQLIRKNIQKHHPFINNYPKFMNYLTRLKLVSILAVNDAEQTLNSLQSFLKMPLWGIPAQASLVLIEEMPIEAKNILKQLLEDQDPKIRVQAALILASSSQDKSVLPILEAAYPHVPTEIKFYIIDALGHIGDKSTHPFLIELLKSPIQSYKMAASGALIKSLNN